MFNGAWRYTHHRGANCVYGDRVSSRDDKVVVENIIAGLARNKMKYGYAYCPCREVKGAPENDRDNICPCRSHREEIARHGTCECGLEKKSKI